RSAPRRTGAGAALRHRGWPAGDAGRDRLDGPAAGVAAAGSEPGHGEGRNHPQRAVRGPTRPGGGRHSSRRCPEKGVEEARGSDRLTKRLRQEACCWGKGFEWVEDEAGTVDRSTPMSPEVRQALEKSRASTSSKIRMARLRVVGMVFPPAGRACAWGGPAGTAAPRTPPPPGPPSA